MKIKIVEKVDLNSKHKDLTPQNLYDSDHAKVMHVTFQPGVAQSKHINNVSVLFYFLEGSGRIEVNSISTKIEEGIAVESPANSEHCIYNDSDTIMRVLVIKTPHPRTLKK
jgi:mannose-6-phosphate isomerase-like protein (cupin superfamily)